MTKHSGVHKLWCHAGVCIFVMLHPHLNKEEPEIATVVSESAGPKHLQRNPGRESGAIPSRGQGTILKAQTWNLVSIQATADWEDF